MTYYEELGLPRDASVQEIHQAYRVLARLVHPDGQPNEQVRNMAERQMKRLNHLLATLTDPQRRREYDDSLLALSGAPAPAPAAGNPTGANPATMQQPSPVRFRRQPEPRWTSLPAWATAILTYWFWIVLAVVILGVGGWYVSAGNSAPTVELNSKPLMLDELHPVLPPAPSASAQHTLPAPLETPHSQTAVPTGPVPEPADRREPAPVVAPLHEAVPVKEAGQAVPAPRAAAPPVPAPPVAAPPVLASVEPSNALAVSRPATPSFAGNWLYVPSRGETPSPQVYPATYAEFLLTEQHGELSGSYRARYKIPDQAVSPEVSFKVQGNSPAGESATLGWISADGAKGEVELALHGPDVLSVTWWTTEFGRHPSLVSGTAKLLRQRAQ
jgi:hypothetical protein